MMCCDKTWYNETWSKYYLRLAHGASCCCPSCNAKQLAKTQTVFVGWPKQMKRFLFFFAGLLGQVIDVSFVITAQMLIFQVTGSSLQNNCAEPGDNAGAAQPLPAVTICISYWRLWCLSSCCCSDMTHNDLT